MSWDSLAAGYASPRFMDATATTRTPEAVAARLATTADNVRRLNPGLQWPVNVGTRIRIS